MGKVVSLAEIAKLRDAWQNEGRRVVFTNGCFDLLHLGHVRYLKQARALGDLLILGLNSDNSVHKIKGPKRPILLENERAAILAALTMVDYVLIFDDETAERVVRAIKPDIYVKGGDYPLEKNEQAVRLPEVKIVYAYGGKVVILPFVEGRSTSEIIRTIVSRYGTPSDQETL